MREIEKERTCAYGIVVESPSNNTTPASSADLAVLPPYLKRVINKQVGLFFMLYPQLGRRHLMMKINVMCWVGRCVFSLLYSSTYTTYSVCFLEQLGPNFGLRGGCVIDRGGTASFCRYIDLKLRCVLRVEEHEKFTRQDSFSRLL